MNGEPESLGAGVGEATLFHRLPTKDALIDAILEQKMGESVEFFAELAAEPDSDESVCTRAPAMP